MFNASFSFFYWCTRHRSRNPLFFSSLCSQGHAQNLVHCGCLVYNGSMTHGFLHNCKLFKDRGTIPYFYLAHSSFQSVLQLLVESDATLTLDYYFCKLSKSKYLEFYIKCVWVFCM